MTYEEVKEAMNKAYEEYHRLSELEQQMRPLRNATKSDLRCRMTYAEMQECVDDGTIISDDGVGHFGTENQISDILYDPGDDFLPEFTHIYWYGK